MKTEFKCGLGQGDQNAGHEMTVRIIGTEPNNKPYVVIYGKTSKDTTQVNGWIEDDDLETFAVNILKSIKSKKLK